MVDVTVGLDVLDVDEGVADVVREDIVTAKDDKEDGDVEVAVAAAVVVVVVVVVGATWTTVVVKVRVG